VVRAGAAGVVENHQLVGDLLARKRWEKMAAPTIDQTWAIDCPWGGVAMEPKEYAVLPGESGRPFCTIVKENTL